LVNQLSVADVKNTIYLTQTYKKIFKKSLPYAFSLCGGESGIRPLTGKSLRAAVTAVTANMLKAALYPDLQTYTAGNFP